MFKKVTALLYGQVKGRYKVFEPENQPVDNPVEFFYGAAEASMSNRQLFKSGGA